MKSLIFGKKGSMSVLLTMVFISILVVLGTAAEAGSRVAGKSQGEGIMDLAGRSVLAQYNQELKERYHLFGCDKSDQQIENELRRYSETSFESLALSRVSLVNINVDSSLFSLGDVDNFESQILNDMKYKIVEDGLPDIKELLTRSSSALEKTETLNEEIEREETALVETEANMKEQLRQLQENEEPEGEAHVQLEDSLQEIEDARKLQKALRRISDNDYQEDGDTKKDMVLKNKRVWDNIPSQQAGVGTTSFYSNIKDFSEMISEGNILISLRNSLYTDEYIIDHFRNFVDGGYEGETFFENEVEYILYGNPSDQKNKRTFTGYLLALRTSLNIYHIYSDPEKRAQALMVANSLTPGVPAKLTQLLVISAWGALEAGNDMKNLENGNAVPFLKDKESWALSIQNLMEIAEDGVSQGYIEIQTNSGLNYRGYLKIFLAMTDQETKLLRVMDLIQINMKGSYREDFVLADCCTGFQIKAQLEKGSLYERIAGSRASIEMVHVYG